MAKIKIDSYGFQPTSVDYFKRKLKVSDVAKSSDGKITYMRFTVGSPCPIHRIDESDGVSIRWAYGEWEQRESLNYENDLNTPLEITQ